MTRIGALILLAAVAVAGTSAAQAHLSARTSAKLNDCTCYDLVVTATDRRPRTIFHNTGQNLYDVLPNLKLMVFSGPYARLYVSPTNSHAKRLLDARYSWWAVFSPDGKRLAYAVDGCGICIIDVDGTNPHPFAVAGAAGPVAWSPDGRRLAFVGRKSASGRDEGTLMVANLDGSNARPLLQSSNFAAGTSLGVKMAWSPRGDRIAYLAGFPPRVHIVRVADGHDETVGTGFAPVWSPSGRQLAFTLERGVAVVRADGSHRRQLDPLALDGYGMGVSWSPKSRRISYARWTKTGRYQLAIARADGTHRRVLTTEAKHVEIGPMYWSRDGQTILYGTYLQLGP
jgi:Tol biopolymer transport system component